MTTRRRIDWPVRFAATCLGVLACALPAAAQAGASAPPFAERVVSINARGQDVRDFLSDLFGQSGLRVKVSSAATGIVQGVFIGKSHEVWDTVSRAYGLVAYYDGGVVRVYAQGEIGTRTIATGAPALVVGEIARMNIADSVNKVRGESGLVVATGVPAFLDRVEAIAATAKMSAPPVLAAVTPATPALPSPAVAGTGAVASPILRAPAARLPVRSQLLVAAGRRSPFELRIFFLNYRDAADKQLSSAGQDTIVPGVATLLREQMGDGRGAGTVSSAGTNQYRAEGLQLLGSGSNDALVTRMRGGPPAASSTDDGAVASGGEGDLNGPRITADTTNNAILVRDRPEMMPVYEGVITTLDTEPLMIEVEAMILEVSTNKMRELGVDWNLGIGGLRLAFGGDIQSGVNGALGGSYLSGNGDQFAVRIRALEQRGALRVVRRPVMSTPSNQVATFDDTARQVARLQGERVADAVSLNYGLSMRVKPSVIEDGRDLRIRMQIEISDTRLTGMVVDGIPVSSGPSISTQSIVRNGESVMIAGMTSDTEYDYKSKTPVLGDIPLVGQAFRRRNDGRDHMERLVLITPRVVSGSVRSAANLPPPIPLEQLQGRRPMSAAP